MGQQRGIAHPIPQGRDVDDDLGQSVIQIFAKTPFLAQRMEILMGGADNAHIHGNLLAAAHSFNGSLLQKPQKLGLQLKG